MSETMVERLARRAGKRADRQHTSPEADRLDARWWLEAVATEIDRHYDGPNDVPDLILWLHEEAWR